MMEYSARMHIRDIVTSAAIAAIRAVNRHKSRVLSSRLHNLADDYDPSDGLDCRYSTDVPAAWARMRYLCHIHDVDIQRVLGYDPLGG